MEQHWQDVLSIGTALVTIASALANIVPKHTILGRACNWLALNFKK